MFLRSDDGFLRMSLDDLLSTPLLHLVSGLDGVVRQFTSRCGSPTDISGYTEWVSASDPQVSLGWSWRLDMYADGCCRLTRVGLPYSNVMLVDEKCRDYEWGRSLELLATIVDAMPWRDKTIQALS